ncbi:hypothetical protein EB118_18460 [bacterium]|nr:hypothetical protein [bacterium]NBX98284.1 hypothetical protein [bacterium]NDC95208.1 hypothetical protein [bacterium]NDD84365.1 hypothetical protein [bacterium]NDG32044.1 hypothetical protein [bacterium]
MPKKNPSQLEISFENRPNRVIPIKYDETMALAARRRRDVRMGAILVNPTNKGFMKLDKGLWLPASKGELSTAVDSPILAIRKSKSLVYEKTHHKGYARRAANETRKNIERYYVDAHEQRWKLTTALLQNPKRSYTEYTLTHSDFALEGIARYVMDLNSFIERDWPQKRWGRYESNMNRATHEVKSLYIDDLFSLYDEAVWNVRSRMRFWHERGMNAIQPPEVPTIPFNTINPMVENEVDET